jgi:DNA replication protein DnaD
MARGNENHFVLNDELLIFEAQHKKTSAYMETLTQIKEAIKEALANGIEEGLRTLEQFLATESPKFDQFAGLKNKYSDTQINLALGKISIENRGIVVNQIRDSLLNQFLEELEVMDIAQAYRPAGVKLPTLRPIPPFDRKFPRYKLDVLRLDRTNVAALFKERFGEMEKNKVKTQHYFIYADRHQQPGSFVERMIFELETSPHLLNYEAEGDKHIAIRELDLAGNLEVSKLRLCEYFEERFGGPVSYLLQAEQFFAPTDRYPYLITVLKIHVRDWQPHTADFFKWFFNDFCITDPAIPTRFLFFFIFQKDTAAAGAKRSFFSFLSGKSSQQKDAEALLDSLKTKPGCTVFPELKPISLHDLIKWLSDFISNESVIDKLLKEILGTEKYGDQFDLSLVESQLVAYLAQRQGLATA